MCAAVSSCSRWAGLHTPQGAEASSSPNHCCIMAADANSSIGANALQGLVTPLMSVLLCMREIYLHEPNGS